MMRSIKVDNEEIEEENDIEEESLQDADTLKIKIGAKLIRQLFTKNPDMETEITELTDAEIINLASMHTIDEVLGVPLYDTFMEGFKRLKISKHRRGRREIIESMKAMFTSSEEDGESSSLEKRSFIRRALSGFTK